MSIFGTIMSKIFHHGEAAAAPASAPASHAPTPSAPTSSALAPSASASDASPLGAAPPASPTTAGDPTATTTSTGGSTQTAADNPTSMSSTSAPAQSVDVGQVLDGLAAKNSQKLDWKHSIVDMMKLLDLDSSLTARQELAKELNYTGNMQDSAAMNIWLHKQVMQKLAQNGGKVPDDLKG